MLELSFWRDIERGRLQLESVYVPSPLCVCVRLCGLFKSGRVIVFLCGCLYVSLRCAWHLDLTVSILTNSVFTRRQQFV